MKPVVFRAALLGQREHRKVSRVPWAVSFPIEVALEVVLSALMGR